MVAKAAKTVDVHHKKVFKLPKLKLAMHTPDRDMILLLRNGHMSQRAIEAEMEQINVILHQAECHACFCQAHELVRRNSITSKHKHILQAISRPGLRPFYFLINRN